MAANRDAGVDPRFDPVFQRGYDPAKHGGRRPHHAPRPSTDETPVTPIRESVVEASPEVLQAVPEDQDAAIPAATPEPDLALHRRNPFRLALLITSVVAIGGACLLIWNRIEENPYYQGFSGTDLPRLFRSQLIDAALAPLLTVGLLGLCLWLAIGALGRGSLRRRNDE